MRILALDTSSAACSAAVSVDGVIAGHRFEVKGRGHAERLMPMVAEAMAAAEMKFTALDLLATTIGPGTFTGLRVGLAAARGLALAGGLPLAGVTTFEAVAHQAAAIAGGGAAVPDVPSSDLPLVVALDARRGKIYAQAFDAALESLGPAHAGPAHQFVCPWPSKSCRIAGNGAALLVAAWRRHGVDAELDASSTLPDAAAVADLCHRRYTCEGPSLPTRPPSPLYLRSSGARTPEGRQP